MRDRAGRQALERSLTVDALLYSASAMFALGLMGTSSLLRNRTWAEFAWPAYAAGASVAVVLAVVGVRLARAQVLRARLALAAVVAAGAVFVPLAVEVRWRAEPARAPASSLHPYGASEVVLTEGAARELLRGRDPYSAYFRSHELDGRSPSTAQHFPYLPGMIAFGLPYALAPGATWTDARLFFLAVTAVAAALALRRWRAPPEQRLRAVQVLVVLPTGAAALVTGGDDVPVLALGLLALALFDSGRRAASMWAAAAAAILKLTAWPLLLALAVAAPRGRGRLALGAVGLVTLTAAATGPVDFVDDVLLFPAGLSDLPSPAASTTLGSTMIAPVRESPTPRVVMTVALLTVGLAVAVIVLRALARRTRVSAADTAIAAGLVLLALIVLAPVARSGYLVYPLDLVAWAMVLRSREPVSVRVGESREALAW